MSATSPSPPSSPTGPHPSGRRSAPRGRPAARHRCRLGRASTLWHGRVRHDRPERHAVRLVAHERYEAWLIGWPAGHRTTPHDHGESIGALAVVEGSLVERTVGADGSAGASARRRFGDPPRCGHGARRGCARGRPRHQHPRVLPAVGDDDLLRGRIRRPGPGAGRVEEAPLLDGRALAMILHPSAAASRG